jgi:hypothetical protein
MAEAAEAASLPVSSAFNLSGLMASPRSFLLLGAGAEASPVSASASRLSGAFRQDCGKGCEHAQIYLVCRETIYLDQVFALWLRY